MISFCPPLALTTLPRSSLTYLLPQYIFAPFRLSFAVSSLQHRFKSLLLKNKKQTGYQAAIQPQYLLAR